VGPPPLRRVKAKWLENGTSERSCIDDKLISLWWAVQDSNLRPPACKAGFAAIEKVPSTYVNQSLPPNNRSHGRSRGALKNLEKLAGL
jgi:hypothetical protein